MGVGDRHVLIGYGTVEMGVGMEKGGHRMGLSEVDRAGISQLTSLRRSATLPHLRRTVKGFTLPLCRSAVPLVFRIIGKQALPTLPFPSFRPHCHRKQLRASTLTYVVLMVLCSHSLVILLVPEELRRGRKSRVRVKLPTSCIFIYRTAQLSS